METNRSTRSGWRRLVASAAAGGLVCAGLVSCSWQGDDPKADAKRFAGALESGDYESIIFHDRTDAKKLLDATFGNLDAVRPKVTVNRVYEDGNGKSTAELGFSWGLGMGEDDGWSYTTKAPMELMGDTWRPVWSPAVIAPVSPGESLRVRHTAGPRGRILGAGGAVIVTERKIVRIGVDKTAESPGSANAAARLARLVGVAPAGFSKRVAAAGPKAFVEAVTLRAGDAKVPSPAQLKAIPGARSIPGTATLAPDRTFARPLLGSVGEATQEVVKESEGGVVAGTQTGLSGLQRAFDPLLAGRPAVEVLATKDDASRSLYRHDAVPGKALTLTLDVPLQTKAEKILASVKPASAIVAIKPSTGEILVAASGPGSDGLSTATQGRYAPGSTFKLVTALALLRDGSTPSSVLPCPATISVDGRAFKNYGDFPPSRIGALPLRDALAQSCNTAFISQRNVIAQGDLTSAALSLGLGESRDLGVTSFSGDVPDTAASQTEHAASMIGQGKVLASPLGMATVVASIAAARTVTPRLVAPPATPVDPDAPSRATARPLTESEASSMRSMMRDVVTRGTASVLKDAGPEVMAKSGTAEYGSAKPPKTHAWMVAIDKDLAVAVLVADGPSGGRTAGPLMKRILQ